MGAAGGFTRRLTAWVVACLIFGVLAVVVFMAAAVFSGVTETLTYQAGPGGASRPVAGAPRALAAELLGPAEIAQLLGQERAEMVTPGAGIVRSRSVAIWRNRAGTASLTVKYSRWQAARLQRSGPQARRYGRVLRVRAGQAEWLVALQVRDGAVADPEPLLTELAGQALGRLAAQ